VRKDIFEFILGSQRKRDRDEKFKRCLAAALEQLKCSKADLRAVGKSLLGEIGLEPPTFGPVGNSG
jgi:hypothetical protein